LRDESEAIQVVSLTKNQNQLINFPRIFFPALFFRAAYIQQKILNPEFIKG